METYMIMTYGFSVIIIILFIQFIVALIKEKREEEEEIERIDEEIEGLANNTIEMTPEEFMDMRNKSLGGRGNPSYALEQNFAGVYILYNKTKNMYYVGQGKRYLIE